jgi:hypothetical protein
MKEIFDFNNSAAWLPIIAGVLLAEVVGIALYAHWTGNQTFNNWYKTFGLSAIISDCTILLIGFAVARFLYTKFLSKRFGFSPILFLLLLIAIQIIHDISYYYLVVKPLPKGTNKIIDYMKIYGKEYKAYAIIGDSKLYIMVTIFAYILNKFPREYSIFTIILSLYIYPYLLN